MAITLYDLVGTDHRRPFSPHCWKTAMSLKHKGLAFERVPVTFTAIPAIEGGAAATVPTIRDGDTLVTDSFAIAEYLDRTYPDRPALFGSDGAKAHARFVERWSQTVLHAALTGYALMDIHAALDPADQAYYRTSREARLGKPLEEVAANRAESAELFRKSLEPLRSMLAWQPYIGGATPLFADYIVLGAFQWVRAVSGTTLLAENDPVAVWLDSLLDRHDGFARHFGHG